MSTILVVDDDLDICELIRFKLTQQGHEVIVEHDGDAGLAAARQHQPEVLVLDWMMPRLSGLELCLEVRADAALADAAIILVTAKAQEPDIQRGFAAGADDYIVKPFSPRELATRVDALLARQHR